MMLQGHLGHERGRYRVREKMIRAQSIEKKNIESNSTQHYRLFSVYIYILWHKSVFFVERKLHAKINCWKIESPTQKTQSLSKINNKIKFKYNVRYSFAASQGLLHKGDRRVDVGVPGVCFHGSARVRHCECGWEEARFKASGRQSAATKYF